jgi:hypothetical protein
LLRHTRQVTYNAGYHAIPREWDDSEPERFKQAAAELHSAANLVCAAYDAPVRTARTKLAA